MDKWHSLGHLADTLPRENDRRGISVLSGTKSRRPRRFQGMLTNVSRAWAGKPPSADEVRKRKAEQPRFGSNPDPSSRDADDVRGCQEKASPVSGEIPKASTR
jgi:hypothetical protein